MKKKEDYPYFTLAAVVGFMVWVHVRTYMKITKIRKGVSDESLREAQDINANEFARKFVLEKVRNGDYDNVGTYETLSQDLEFARIMYRNTISK